MPFEMEHDVRACCANERSDALAGSRRQDGKAARSRAAKQSQKYGFGAVVGVVRRREKAGRARNASGLERRVAGGTGARLEVSAGRERNARARKRHSDALGKTSSELELVGRLRPETVIHGVRNQLEVEFFAQVREHVEKRHRVGTARNRDENATPSPDAALLDERSARERDECRWVRARHALRSRARSRSRELELLAELEVSPRGEIDSRVRLGRVPVRAARAFGRIMGAIFAAEPEREPPSFVAQALIDDRSH
jgi:hypothetical protein